MVPWEKIIPQAYCFYIDLIDQGKKLKISDFIIISCKYVLLNDEQGAIKYIMLWYST